jgi:hypothetical protein
LVSENPFVDDRDQQGTLDIGEEAARTEGRESSLMGSEAFADDRDSESDGGEQFNLFSEEEELDGQASLGGGQATRETEGFFGGGDSSSSDLFGVSDSGEPEPILSADERHRAGMDFEQIFGPEETPRGFDVSLSPEEAFDGVGATSSRAIGGFNPTPDAEIKRSTASGRFAHDTNQTTLPGVNRRQTSGRFVSSPLAETDIGRNTETGRFVDRGDR